MPHLKFNLIMSSTKEIFVSAWCKSNHSTARSKWTNNDFRSSFELTELLCNPFFAKRTSKDHSFEVMAIFSVSFVCQKILHLHQEFINITLHLSAALLFVFMWCRQDLKTQTVATTIFFGKKGQIFKENFTSIYYVALGEKHCGCVLGLIRELF